MKILITGASCQIGDYLLPKVSNVDHVCFAVSRKIQKKNEKISWVDADLEAEHNFFIELAPIDVWVNLAPLRLADRWIEKAAEAGIRRFIGFSTTSIFTKQQTSEPNEIKFVSDICHSEQTIQKFCEASQINWTFLRPTLVYGSGRDQNIAFITKMVSLFGFFPIVGNGQGLRQPVHAEDLADACFAVLTNQSSFNKAYNLSGGETLTYRAMVERIFEWQNKTARIFPIPVFLLKGIIKILALLPACQHLNSAMVDRINQNMVFEHHQAKLDFNYSPRGFLACNASYPSK